MSQNQRPLILLVKKDVESIPDPSGKRFNPVEAKTFHQDEDTEGDDGGQKGQIGVDQDAQSVDQGDDQVERLASGCGG